MIPLFLSVLIGYLFGSIPFGLILTKLAGLGDIRSIGSGNIGATNVLRTGNKPLAFLTLILDGGKGAAAIVLGTMTLIETPTDIGLMRIATMLGPRPILGQRSFRMVSTMTAMAFQRRMIEMKMASLTGMNGSLELRRKTLILTVMAS